MKNKILKRRAKIKKRVRSRIVRQSEYPRLTVHRTNNHVYVQVVDDHKGTTLLAINDVKLEDSKLNRTQRAQAIGKDLASLMKKKKIAQVVFDRGCYPYKGRIKALAEAVREAGITI